MFAFKSFCSDGAFEKIAARYPRRKSSLIALVAALAAIGCGDPGELASGEEPTEEVRLAGGLGIPQCIPPQVLTPTPTGFVCRTPPGPPQPQNFNIIPDFYVTHVVYAPPGDMSNISYAKSSSVGSSTSVSNGFKDEISVTAKAGGSFVGGGTITASAGLDTSTERTDDVEWKAEFSQTYTKYGQVDRIDHNYDEIWFLIRPKLNASYTPPPSNRPFDKPKVTWQFGDQDGINYGIPYFVYAGWLNNAMQMPNSVRQTLEAYGITPDKYAAMLSADPLFTGATPNMAMDPNRFRFVDAFPFVPPYSETELPSTQAYSVDTSASEGHSLDASTDISVGLGFEGEFNVGVVKASLEIETKWTWTSSSSFSTETGTGSSDTFTVAQPDFGYSGPTLLRVYQDTIWNTYAFSLDYPQGETNLALNRDSWQSTNLEGYQAWASLANDGNTSGNFWDGSVTHTAAGYFFGAEGWPGQFWYVDLGSERVVNAVNIFNRTDCCSERLSNYNILAYSSTTGNWEVISNHSTDNVTGVPFLHHPINMVKTQYVMVAKTDDNYLSLAEVQVMGF